MEVKTTLTRETKTIFHGGPEAHNAFEIFMTQKEFFFLYTSPIRKVKGLTVTDLEIMDF